MPDYNAISLPNWQQLVRRIFGLTGPGGNVPTLSPEIQPVAIIQPDQAETWILRDRLPCVGFARAAAGGGTAGLGVQLLNPTGSGKLIVIETWRARAIRAGPGARGGTITFEINQNTLPTLGNASSRDMRRLVTPAGQMRQSAIAIGAAVGVLASWAYPGTFITTDSVPNDIENEPAQNTYPILENLILLPGFSILQREATPADAQAKSCDALVHWYERPLERAEELG